MSLSRNLPPGGESGREIITLFAEYQRTFDSEIREEIISEHLYIVKQIAGRFSHHRISEEDLRSAGKIGLLRAFDRFDPNRGVKFSTYAASTIVGEIKRCLRDQGWYLRVPRELKERYLAIHKVIDKLEQSLGRSPRIPEIAQDSGVTEEMVLEALEAGSALGPLSLDGEGNSDSKPLLAVLVDAEDIETSPLLERIDIERALKKLDPPLRMVVTLYYYHGMRQSEIATRLKISQMQVSRLLRKAVESLKEGLGRQEGYLALGGR